MKKDIMLCGVGGQGILTLSYAIVMACVDEGLHVVQSEIHGMSQRGGSVYADLRISSSKIHSNLIGRGKVDIILALEPLEALRWAEYLNENGILITNMMPVKNIQYPDEDKVMRELKKYNCTIIDAKSLAMKAGNSLSQNMVLLGAVSKYLPLSEKVLKKYIKEMFAKKGKEIVNINLKAFDLGRDQA